MTDELKTITAFQGKNLVATGNLAEVLPAVKNASDRNSDETVLIFDDRTGAQIDFDLHGTMEEVLAKSADHPLMKTASFTPQKSGVGRPKLGVTPREVTLLPRHWSWLETRPNGVSAALRRVVDEAMRREDPYAERMRAARDAAAKAMWVLAGNLEGFEEASRLLFRGDLKELASQILPWPKDIRAYLLRLLSPSISTPIV